MNMYYFNQFILFIMSCQWWFLYVFSFYQFQFVLPLLEKGHTGTEMEFLNRVMLQNWNKFVPRALNIACMFKHYYSFFNAIADARTTLPLKLHDTITRSLTDRSESWTKPASLSKAYCMVTCMYIRKLVKKC